LPFLHIAQNVGRRADFFPLLLLLGQIPSHLLSAFTTAKDQTLFIPSALSKEAFALSSTRTSITSFLKTRGLLEPNLSREVLLEYTGRKERVVKGWPGGVRAGIEVVQGGLRDVGIEVSLFFSLGSRLGASAESRSPSLHPSSSVLPPSLISSRRSSSRRAISAYPRLDFSFSPLTREGDLS
jgi:hypothetical protein